jgi:hypothetical protein
MFAKEFTALSEIRSKAQAIEAQVEAWTNFGCDELALKIIANKWMATTLNKITFGLGPLEASELKTKTGQFVIQLQGLVLELDAIESHGNKTLREARKHVVTYINSLVLPRADTLLRRAQSLTRLQDKLRVELKAVESDKMEEVEETEAGGHDEEQEDKLEQECSEDKQRQEQQGQPEQPQDEEEKQALDETMSESDSESETETETDTGDENEDASEDHVASRLAQVSEMSKTRKAEADAGMEEVARDERQVPSPKVEAPVQAPVQPQEEDAEDEDEEEERDAQDEDVCNKNIGQRQRPQEQRPRATHKVDIRANAAVITIDLPFHVDTDDAVLELERTAESNILNVRDRYNRFEPLRLALSRRDLVAERARVVPDDVSASRMHIVVPRRMMTARPRMTFAPQPQVIRRPIWGW